MPIINNDPATNEVEHPPHYNWHPIAECIEIVRYFGYNEGSAIAYIWRAKHKGQELKDLKKARQHIEDAIAVLEAQEEDDEEVDGV